MGHFKLMQRSQRFKHHKKIVVYLINRESILLVDLIERLITFDVLHEGNCFRLSDSHLHLLYQFGASEVTADS
jgi:hypothetical protein